MEQVEGEKGGQKVPHEELWYGARGGRQPLPEQIRSEGEKEVAPSLWTDIWIPPCRWTLSG